MARWTSAAGLIVCILGWGVFGTLSLVDQDLIAEPAQRFTMTALGVLTLALLGVQLTTRAIHWQRRIVRNQEAIHEALEAVLVALGHQREDHAAPASPAGPAAEVIRMPSPESVAAVKRLAAHLSLAD